VEQAFASGFRNLAALREPSGVGRWLGRAVIQLVCRRLSGGRWLRWVRRPERPDFLGLRSQLVLLVSDSERSEVTRFYEHLEELSVDARMAFLLREIEQMDVRDIAHAMRASVAKARRWLLLAERRLRRFGAGARTPALLRNGSNELPIPFSEFERAQVHRRIEAALERRPERRRWPLLAASVVVLGLSAGVVLLRQPRAVAAEQPVLVLPTPSPQSIELPDGSRATLSPSAELRVEQATPHEVRLTLLSGRADFELAPREERTFVESAADAAVSAFGRRLSMSIEGADPATGAVTLEVSASEGPAVLLRRTGSALITLDSGESWTGRVPRLATSVPTNN
jgi:DNA-directed RNA polymerase specialized sigma24 family protein